MATRTTTAARGGAALLALAVALAGCGGGDEDPGDDAATDAATASEPADDGSDADAGDGTAGGGDATTISVAEFAFAVASTTVPVGATVTWENADGAGHTVTSGTPDDPSGVFDVELPADGTASVVVEEAGTVPYFCRIHPSMTAELVVEPA